MCGFMLQSRAKYLHVAKQMKSYEDQLYEQWREGVEHILPGLLRRNLLVKPLGKDSSSNMDDGGCLKENEAGARAQLQLQLLVSLIMGCRCIGESVWGVCSVVDDPSQLSWCRFITCTLPSIATCTCTSRDVIVV